MVDSKVTVRLDLAVFLERSRLSVLLDVRSPSEFSRGHIPGAISLPLFDDAERALVGTSYKQDGREKAILEGLQLVGPKLGSFARKMLTMAEDGCIFIYCARGGMRSNSMAWLAGLLQVEVFCLSGGYRSYRQWVARFWEKKWCLRILGGYTGVGKTQLLNDLETAGAQVIDLEALANHKGSAFGGILEPPQPSQSQFENNLAERMCALDENRPIWIEDESRLVGHRIIPSGLWSQMRRFPVLYVQRPMSFRLKLLMLLYGEADSDLLVKCTEKIQRRLGPQKTKVACDAILTGRLEIAISMVLEYYDKTYDHGLSKRQKVARIDLGTDTGFKAVKRLDDCWAKVWNEEVEFG